MISLQELSLLSQSKSMQNVRIQHYEPYIFFFARIITFSKKMKVRRLHEVTLKPKSLYLNMSHISVNRAFNWFSYRLCRLNKEKDIIILLEAARQKILFFMIFTPMLHKNCKAEGTEIPQEHYFVCSP